MAQELLLLVKLQDDASAALRNLGKDIESVGLSWKSVLAIAATIGTAVAFISKATAAYEAQHIALIKLQTVMGNIGINYSSLSKEINSVTSDYSKNTSYGITEQTNALARLISITRSYTDSMKYLPLAMDVATMGGMDLASAATMIGRALEGNTRILSQWGFNIKDMAGDPAAARRALDDLANTLDSVSSKVQTSGDRLKTSWSDLLATLGKGIAPGTDAIKNAFTSVLDIIRSVAEADQRLMSRMGGTYGIDVSITGNAEEKASSIDAAIDNIPSSKSVAIDIVERVTSGWSYSSIYGLVRNEQLEYMTWLREYAARNPPPGFQGWEGPIPGPIGQPYLATVHGGEIISQPGRGSGGSVNVNIYNSGSVITSQDLMTQIRREVLWAKSRNYNAGLA